MPTQRITFTEWTPDQPGIAENLSVAKNVVPSSLGFRPFPTAVDYSAAASENLNNVFAGRFNNTTTLFAGGATKLFRFDSADLSMDDVSKSGGYSNITKWNFVQFGDTIITANNVNKLQYWTLGSSTTFNDITDAPIAKYVAVVRDFVVAANLNSGTDSNKIQWSDINDEQDWTAGGASQSDFQILADGGNITGLTGGEFGLVLLERAIMRMTYIGSPFFFQFDAISKTLGCVEGNSVVKYGNMTYFLGDDGFYSCDGQNITPIGNNRVDKWFYSNANPSKINTMSATSDPLRKLIIWNFLDNFGKRQLLIYNWQSDKWSSGDTDTTAINYAATAGATLEGLDIYGSLDALTTSLDDPLWAGGQLLFTGVRGAKIVTFTGANATAELATGDIGSEANTVITLARPIIDNGSANVAISSRTLLTEVVEYGSYTAATSENRVSLRSAGKYHRLSIVPTGSQWSNAIAIDIDITNQGVR